MFEVFLVGHPFARTSNTSLFERPGMAQELAGVASMKRLFIRNDVY